MEFPQRFGKYTLLKRLATGGMAEIFLAHQRGLGGFEKEVVVKRLSPEHAGNEELVTMFLDEARIAAHLTHPNIAQIYDLGQIGDDYFIAMEYVRGVDLRRLCAHGIAVNNYLPLNHAVRVIAEVCGALEYAHTRTDADGQAMDIVHRDISPTNILVTYDGGVKLVDFGIAKAANKVAVTRSGQIKGKFGYMAPEQTRGDAVDARTDLFAVGINLYEITVGRRLFRGASELETIEAIEACEFPTPREVDGRFPEELETVILHALGQQPEQRFNSAREMQMALEGFLAGAGLRSTSGMLAGYMRHIFRDQLALELDDAARLRAMVRNLPPEEPAVRSRPRSAFIDAATEISGPPVSTVGAALRDPATFDMEEDTAVVATSPAARALMGEGWGRPGVGAAGVPPAAAPRAVPVARSAPAARPAQPAQAWGQPVVARPAAPQPAAQPVAAGTPQWPPAAPQSTTPQAHDPWGALNAVPSATPRPSVQPVQTWAAPTTPPEELSEEDLRIRSPRSYTGLLLLLLVVTGGAGLWWVMDRDLRNPPVTRGNGGVFRQPKLNAAIQTPKLPPVAPAKKTLLRVESDPPGARVVVNGNLLGALTPTAVQSIEGRWSTVRLLLPGYLPVEKRLKLAGDGMTLSVPLTKGRPPTGALHVESAPSGAEVVLNGQEVGVTPLTLPKVAAQTVLSLQVVKGGYYPHHVSYTIKADERGDIGIRLVPDTGDRRMAVVNVESIPSGASVSRIEPIGPPKALGRTGRYPVKINAVMDGHLHVRAEAPRFGPQEETLDIRAPYYTVYLRLPVPERFQGQFSIIGARGVTVYLDAEELGKSPIRKHVLDEGEHTLVLYDEKTKQRVERTIFVKRNQLLQKSVVRKGDSITLN